MGKILVLAEKPSVGKELARVLGAKRAHDGYMEGDRYLVTWALGHLVTLADPEHYGEQYKKWSMDTLPMLPKQMDLTVIKESARQFKVVKSLLLNPVVDSLVIATDAGREGELVARWIVQKAGFKKEMKRLWISSQTDKAILEGFCNLRPAKEYDNLYRSAQARANADWLVGLNITRALTCKFNAQLSAGRVQTPTLAMICEREDEIRRHKPVEYYTLTAKTQGMTLTWRDKDGQTRSFGKDRLEAVKNKISHKTAVAAQVKKEQKRTPPPLLYDLTELQRDANKKYGYSAKTTLNCMQALYERHKILTYPRTDSRYLSEDIVPTLQERVRTVAISVYAPFAREVLKGGIKPSKRFVDNQKVSDHHAIIPTEQYVDLAALSMEERHVYDLVVRRFLAVLLPDFVYEQTSVTATCEGETFTAKGKIVKVSGWKAVYGTLDEDEDEADEKEQSLPELSQGARLPILSAAVGSGKTKPPARYTEGTLLSAMENPQKFVKNSEMKSILSEAGGLGTPATRADIIEKLYATFYIEKHGKEIIPTAKGMQLIGLVPPEIKSPELTARWEEKLTQISKGKLNAKEFDQQMRTYAAELVGLVAASNAKYIHENLTKTRCPNCGEYMLEVNGKRGKMLVCADRECGYRENIFFLSNARCPGCHKRLEIFGEGEKKVYICKCGFKEKFDRFNRQLAENKSMLSKREMHAYMAKQKQEEPLNTLGDLFKDLKL